MGPLPDSFIAKTLKLPGIFYYGGALCFAGVSLNHQQVVCTLPTFGSTKVFFESKGKERAKWREDYEHEGREGHRGRCRVEND